MSLADQFPKAEPFGRGLSDPRHRQMVGEACVRLCEGDQDRARTLWKLVTQDCGGYMPSAAALALLRAANTINLVPDVEAPDGTG